MIKNGSKLYCPKCNKVAYEAILDIQERSMVSSGHFVYGSGEKVKYQDMIKCWNCFNTDLKLTVSAYWRNDE